MKQYTDITVLLDRSGSMESIKTAMEEAFNSFVEGHKTVPTTRVTLIQFDTQDKQEIVYQGVPVEYAEKLVLKPRGGTPLLDALCDTIDRTGTRLANLPESERPEKVLVVVITDGEENASRTYKRQDVFNRVTKQTRDYNWQFVYLGANQDAIHEAVTFGINPGYAFTYAPSGAGTRSMGQSLTANTVAYASQGGAAVMDSFTDDQREDALGADK